MRPAIALGMLLLVGCGQHEAPPEGVLERDRFTEVLTGATLIEARMNHERTIEQSAAIPMDAYYAELFREEGTDSAQFALSFDHYAKDPLVMRAIYDDVIERLRLRKDEGLQRATPALANDTTLATDSASVLKP
jgi:Domain of unknown function (DUF4296)